MGRGKVPSVKGNKAVPSFSRRQALTWAAALAGTSLIGCSNSGSAQGDDGYAPSDSLFGISLAQWSLHRAFYANPGDWNYLDTKNFAAIAREKFAIDAVEYVNRFYVDQVRDDAYLQDMRKISDDAGVKNLLIMCDDQGRLGDPDEAARAAAVEGHFQWADMAAKLGCRALRVNANSEGEFEEQQKLAADGLRQLAEYTKQYDISVIVENHGGLSSNASWLAGVMQLADHKHVGTLPDFGNFKISDEESYDPYVGVTELMPFARGVSAKAFDFDSEGNETNYDYLRMMKIVLDAGYRGYVGIEYEGDDLSEPEGIEQTKALLERVRETLRPDYA